MNTSQIESLLKNTEPFLPRGKLKNNTVNEILNPDFAYILWLSCHSVAKAARYLESLGVTSYHDKPYTRAAIHLSATHSKYYAEARAKVQEKNARLIRKIRDDAKTLSRKSS
jgi:hypothetical protein